MGVLAALDSITRKIRLITSTDDRLDVNTVDNVSSATVSSGITLNSSTSTVISVANAGRSFFHADGNFNDKASWIKLQAASVDNVKKGIFLNEKEKGVTFWEMPATKKVYTGEISAIADSGNPVIYVTEY